MAKLTTVGIYNYDSHLFDGLTFPAGIDKDIAISQILTRAGEFEVLYPNPTFFSQMITFWGKKHYRTFEKWVEALAEPFNPLYNYDRFEEYVDEKVGTDSRSGSSTASAKDNDAMARTNIASDSRMGEDRQSILEGEMVDNGSSATTQTDGNRNSTKGEDVENDTTTENQVSAFDSSSYSPKEKTIVDGSQVTSAAESELSHTRSVTDGSSNTRTGKTVQDLHATSDNGTSDDRTVQTGASDHSENRTNQESGTSAERIKHTAHLYGNIGVTTSAQMLREFLDIERFNIYENIANIFVDEFCIMVY